MSLVVWRIMKYAANSAAKNMSSLASHTQTPIGRASGRPAGALSRVGAIGCMAPVGRCEVCAEVATTSLWSEMCHWSCCLAIPVRFGVSVKGSGGRMRRPATFVVPLVLRRQGGTGRRSSPQAVASAVLHPVMIEMPVSPTPSRERAVHGRQTRGAVGHSQGSRLF